VEALYGCAEQPRALARLLEPVALSISADGALAAGNRSTWDNFHSVPAGNLFRDRLAPAIRFHHRGRTDLEVVVSARVTSRKS